MADARREAAPDLADRFEVHRGALVVHCYRFLGSYQDAEEATQETFLRAWRGRGGYRAEASVKTWLHRIATRVCLDLLRRRASRTMPQLRTDASDPHEPPGAPPAEVTWLEPFPTPATDDVSLDPESAYSRAESVKLAFVAALQTLPPRQRAVLILHDVLAWSALETAATLEMTVAAVNSALGRARRQLRATHHETGIDSFPDAEPSDPVVVRTLEAYVRAWQHDDIDGLVDAVRADVRLAMPPVPSWYRGREDVLSFLRTFVLPQGPFRLSPSFANAQPAFLIWGHAPDGTEVPVGVQVVTIDARGISAIDSFMSPELAAGFVEAHRGT